MTDEEMVVQLVHRHAQLTDDGDVEARVALYTDDGEVIGIDQVPHRGREAVRAAFQALTSPDRTGKHITSNTIVDVNGDEAVATTDFAFFRVTADGVAPLAIGRYHDSFRRTPEGWRFTRREIQPISAPGAR